MKVLGRVLLIVLLILVLLVIGGVVYALDLTRGPLPQTSGELRVPGLQDRVEIIRDANGVPHIYASNLHDLFFAQGFTQAQDRWWQMEFFRRTGNGQIQQLTGKTESLMGTDIFIRTVGWRRAAERDVANYDGETMIHLQEFSDGVNAYIMNRVPGDLAFEYGVLGLTGVNIPIEPWTPADTLVWAKVMQWDLGGNYDNEEYRQSFIDQLGQDMFNDFFPGWPFGDKPTIVREEDLPITAESASAGKLTTASAPEPTREDRIVAAGSIPLGTNFILGDGEGLGSNNWVVSGSRTASGRPLLANDPHLGIQMPSIWYEIGLHCQPVSDACPMDVTGFAFSPSPAVIIGHNTNIAWGVTNVGPDTQDLYRIQVNPDNELQYRWNGEWRDMTVRDETINFGDGAAPVTIRVRETHLGPIINDNAYDRETGAISGFNNDDPVALRWTALDPGTLFEAVFRVDLATNWEEFRDALRLWDSPSQNFIYADIEGNIGYQTPSNMPIRAEGESGLVPSDCAEDACTWQGYIPFDDLPRIFNPERGYIATANQAVVPLQYYDQVADELGAGKNYIISQEWAVGYRGQRISELLEASSEHTIESFRAIQGDNKLIPAEELAPALAALEIDDQTLAEARDWMLEWDYQLHMSSARAALWMLFYRRLVADTFDDQLAAIDDRGNGNPWQLYVLARLANDPENVWWDDITTSGATETANDILRRALQEALGDARTQLGEDRNAWNWGALHTATFVSNPLGLSGIDLIENLVNRGPVADSGGGPAVNATSWSFSRSDPFDTRSLPSMRMIVDVGAFENSLSIHTTGQSGHPFSPHYADMIDRWRTIEYHPQLWTREQVQSAAAETLTLVPGG
ncbi:MAG: penicillin acylase family protein [Anaerolineae bacterium]|nr:penicillin acylase family protein [Anaerolineae bacterium]